MSKQTYANYRQNIRSGDLLVWSNPSDNLLSRIFFTIIRFFTLSEYVHVGIAYRLNHELYVVEAVMPEIKLTLLTDEDKFWHIPMFIDWRQDYADFLLDKLGQPYSVLDAIKGYFGSIGARDSKWQCAELAITFYRLTGIDLGANYTPSKLVTAVLEKLDTNLTYVGKLTA